MRTRINMSVTTDDVEIITRTVEHFARTAAGLALDGVETFVMIGPETEGD